MHTFLILFSTVLMCTFDFTSCWEDYEIVKYSTVEVNKEYIEHELISKRLSRTQYGLSGYLSLLKGELGNFYEDCTVQISSMGNSQFNMSPVKMQKKTLCSVLNNEYRQFLMDDFRNKSTFPYSDNPDEDLCESIKIPVRWEVTNCVISKEHIPKYLNDGLNKIILSIYYGDMRVMQSMLEIKLY